MAFDVEFTREFEAWWNTLTEGEQDSVARVVTMLQDSGPALGRPYADTLRNPTYPNLKELRPNAGRSPLRILFAFDPARTGLLLIGGSKSRADWYSKAIAKAVAIYAEHLRSMRDS